MKSIITKSIVATAATATALTFGAGIAGAAPAQPKPTHPPVTVQVAPGVQYTGDAKKGETELATPFGIVRTAPGQVAVVDNSGKTLFGNPNLTGPKQDAPGAQGAVNLKNNAADDAKTPKTQAEKNEDIQTAISNAGGNFGLATGIGAMIGGVGGFVIGCALAVPLGLATAEMMFFPACIAGGGALGGVGGILGGAALGIPVGIASGIYEYQQLQANGDL